MTRHILILTIFIINLSVFAQKGSSYFTDGKYTLGGESVTNAEYERFKESLDDHHLGYSRVVRSSNRDVVFDIHINFDELDVGCCWGSEIYPASLYNDQGIVFSDDGAVLNYEGNFAVSDYSSPNFLAFNEGYDFSAPQTISFSNPVSLVQINVGSNHEGQFTMTAYDADGNELTTSTVDNSHSLVPLSVYSPNSISSVIIDQNGGNYYVMDDLKVRTMNLSGTFQGDYYSAEAPEELISFGFSAGVDDDLYTIIDEDGTLETPLEFPLPEHSGDGDIIDFIIRSDWHTKRPKDIEIFYTAPNGQQTVVAAWTHPSKYDPEGGCSEDLDDFLENGSHIDCALSTPSFSIGFFNSEISLSQSDSLTLRILSTWSNSGGINILESWAIIGDYCEEDCPGYGPSPEFGTYSPSYNKRFFFYYQLPEAGTSVPKK